MGQQQWWGDRQRVAREDSSTGGETRSHIPLPPYQQNAGSPPCHVALPSLLPRLLLRYLILSPVAEPASLAALLPACALNNTTTAAGIPLILLLLAYPSYCCWHTAQTTAAASALILLLLAHPTYYCCCWHTTHTAAAGIPLILLLLAYPSYYCCGICPLWQLLAAEQCVAATLA